ncbi:MULTISPECIES: hypothetical protein [Clostridium]|uniref:ABC transporter permease n=2 Tax=Clostridium TaxID=1485 RepID=A0ABP3WTN7_9CLOT|nr:hypothetical protein [Clostridium baratii]STA99105.1 ABC transporter permease [Clostridium baratii]
MGIYKIGIKLMKYQRKDNIFYMITILVSTALIFNMINILNIKGSGFNNIIERTILSMPVLIIILLICFLIFYTNNYLGKLKSKDIAIQLLSGVNVFKLGISLAMQSSILTFISYILGILFGLLLVPIFCLLAKSDGIYLLSSEAFIYSLLIMFVEFLFISVVNIGYGYRNSITDLINDEERDSYIRDNSKKRGLSIKDFRFFIYTFLSLIFLFMPQDKMEENLTYILLIFCLTIYGSIQIINVFIPKHVDKIKSKYFNNKIKIIAINNVKTKIIKNKIISFLIFSISVSVIFSMQVVSSFEKFNLYNRITFIINIVLIAFMIIYRGLYDATNEKNTLNSLILIGYKKSEIEDIIKTEFKYFYSAFLGAPFLMIFMYLMILLIKGILDGIFVLSYILIYISIMSITVFITYFFTMKVMENNNLKRGKSNVCYRSQKCN